MRRNPRYETSIACTVEAEGRPSQAGIIVNISLGGAGIETRGDAPDRFHVVFSYDGEAYGFPCSTRHSRDLWSSRRIHAEFEALDQDQQDALEGLLEAIQAHQAEAGGRPGGFAGAVRRIFRR